MNKDLFKKKSKEIEDAYGAFNEFYASMDEMYKEREVSKDEVEIVKEIHSIVTSLDKGKNGGGIVSWTGDDLTRAEYRLAVYLAGLSGIAAEKIKRSNSMLRWVKFRKYQEWNPAKTKIEESLKEGKRATKDEIEAEVSKQIFAENMMEAFMAGHADTLTLLCDSTKSILTALTHRINLLKEEQRVSSKL